MKTLRRFIASEHGGSAVELSLVVTAFCMVLLGAVEYGWYMWSANALQQTALQTARCMGILQSDCAPSRTYSSTSTTTFARTIAAGYGVNVPTSGVALNINATCGGATNLSQVTLTYTYQSSVPILLPGLSSSPLTAQACFPNQT
jgi:Flp pilus assembly protein TadG